MSEKFVKNAFILSLGVFISKFIGFVFVIPFSYLIGKEGLALYSYAYIPYALFLDLATLGIPMGFSKFVSVHNATGEREYINYSMKRMKILMLVLGISLSIIMMLIAPYYASIVNGGAFSDDSVTIVIRIIAFSIIIVPLMSLYRGYFQGLRIMVHSTISQILEQVVRVLIILLGALIIIKATNNVKWAIYLAVSAAFFGGLTSFIYLRKKYKNQEGNSFLKRDGMYKEIFRYSIPFVVYGCSFTLYSLIDSLMFNRVVENEVIYGIYSFEIQKLVFIPVSIVAAISSALLPNISHNFKIKNIKVIKTDIKKSLLIVLGIILPAVFVTTFFSELIYDLLFEYNKYGPLILRAYMPVALVICLSSITMSIMQGLNLNKILIISILSGLLFKVSFNYMFLELFSFYGAIITTLISYFITVSINVFFIYKNFNSHKKIGF